MNPLSQEQLSLMVYAGVYLLLVALFITTMTWRADRLLADFRRMSHGQVPEDLLKPSQVKNASREIRHAWMRFVHSGRYRTHCSPGLSSRIDAYRRQINIGLTVLTVLGAAIIYRYWATIEPQLF